MDHGYLDDLRDRGYAVVRGVFDAEEVAVLAATFDAVWARAVAHGRSYRHKNVCYRLAQDPHAGTIVRLAQWCAYFDPVLARIRIDPRMLAIVAPLIGRDVKQIINQLHWKPPGAAQVEFGFHQDIRFRRPRSAYRSLETSYVQTGIAVDAHRRANGAMTVLPGSHRLGELAFAPDGRVMERSMSGDDLRAVGLDPAAAVDLELDPGDVALWTVNLVHGSGPNRSAGDRRFYLNGYVRAADCDRGEWAFRDGVPCPLGEPVLVHYEDLYRRPEPHYLD